MVGIAVARLGLSIWDIYGISGYTPRELYYAFKEFDEIHKSKQRVIWESTRWQTWHLININLSRKNKLKSPKQLGRFDWEQGESEVKEQSVEEQEQIFRTLFGQGIPLKERKKRDGS